MIPTNKKLAVLHPYVNKKWWAVNMMIYLSQFLSKNNNVTLYTFSYDKFLFPFNSKKDSGSREPGFNNEWIENKQSFREFWIKAFNNSKLISFIKIAFHIRNCDYIVIWNSPMQFVWVISKLLFWSKAKIIWWHHHYPWYHSSNTSVNIKFKNFLERCLIKRIDLIIVNSKNLQDSIKDTYEVDSKILYPVLDNKFLSYNSKNKNKVLSTTKTIFTYGRRVEGKNLKLIFKTYDDLKNKVSNLVLKIWWEWNELSYYKNKYKNDENIIFLWVVDKKQIIENLEKSNLFLFPSKVDSFWLVILESMIIWVPVISYNLSGAKEIVKNWINWYLVNSDSEFIERSYEVLSNSSLEKNLWKESIKTARTFWKETFNKQLTEIFNSI